MTDIMTLSPPTGEVKTISQTPQDQAWNAARKFRKMKPQLQGLCRAITGDKKLLIKINTSNSDTYTDGKIIFLPVPFELGANNVHERMYCGDRDRDTRQMICPACDVEEDLIVKMYHEMSHIIFGSFQKPRDKDVRQAIERAVARWAHKERYAEKLQERLETAPDEAKQSYWQLAKWISPYLPIIMNALEDVRVNTHMFDARPGIRIMFESWTIRIMENGVSNPNGDVWTWTEAPLNSQVMAALFCMAAGYESKNWFSPEVERDLKDPTLVNLASQIALARNVKDVYELSIPVLNRLREMGYMVDAADEDAAEQTSAQERHEDETDEKGEGESDDKSDSGDEQSVPEGDNSAGESDSGGMGDSESDVPESDESPDEAGGESGSEVPDGDASDPGDNPGSDGDSPDGSGEGSDDPTAGEGSEEGVEGSATEGELEDSSGLGDRESSGDLESGSDSDAGDSGAADDAESEGESESSGQQADGGSDSPDSGGGQDADAGSEESGSGDAGSDQPDDEGSGAGSSAGDQDGKDEGSSSSTGRTDSSSSDTGPDAADSAEGNTGTGDISDNTGTGEPGDSVPGVSDREGSDQGDSDDSDSHDESDGGSEGGRSQDHATGTPDDTSDVSQPDSGDSQGSSGWWSGNEEDFDNATPPRIETEDGVSDEDSDQRDGSDSALQQDGDVDEFDPDKPVRGVRVDRWTDQGTPEEVQRHLEQFGGHKDLDGNDIESPFSAGNMERWTLPAANQSEYWETPSHSIAGVEVYNYRTRPAYRSSSNDVRTTWQVADRLRDSGYTEDMLQRYGVLCDGPIPESVLGPALARTRRAFDDNARKANLRNLRSGKVDPRKLARRAPVNDERLFRKPILPGKRDYHVVIGIDVSGSTSGENIKLAKMAALGQCELLHRVGVRKFEVWAHSTGYSRNPYGETMAMYCVKSLDDPWDKTSREGLMSMGPMSGNLDGHSMEFYRKQLEHSNATDKILLYYTDGKMPASNYSEELEILQREIKICKQRQVALLGVGIRTDSPIEHGLETVQIDDISDLSKVVTHLEKKLHG